MSQTKQRKLRAGAYIRMSTDDQADSPERQRHAPTPAGIEWAASSSRPKLTGRPATAIADLRELYFNQFKASQGSVRANGVREIGPIPMPMSILPRGQLAAALAPTLA